MTDAEAEPAPFGDPDELLYRQVHPSWVKEGQPTSQAFKPTPKDDHKLSVARSTLTTPAEAFEHHTAGLGLASAGTWAVAVNEVSAEPHSLPVTADPIDEPVADPAHALIEFPAEPRKVIETKAKLLLAAARARGRLHPGEAEA